jgi:hypothetical protein
MPEHFVPFFVVVIVGAARKKGLKWSIKFN